MAWHLVASMMKGELIINASTDILKPSSAKVDCSGKRLMHDGLLEN
jgi:hypothetical protein